MSKSFIVLSVLMALTLGLHLFGGGPQYADPFWQILPDGDLRVMGWVLWHAVSVALAVLALAYLWMARRPSFDLLLFTSLLQLGWAALFLTGGVVWLGSLWIQPQWVLFTAFPLLAHLAHWTRGRSESK
jgi:hypothetical protein